MKQIFLFQATFVTNFVPFYGKCTIRVSDQELILHDQCLRGEALAQRALYDRFKGDMFRMCLRYASSREEAEDMLQEGFITVFRDLHQFRGDGPLAGWIRKVIVRAALQVLRRKKIQYTSLDDVHAGLGQNTHSSFLMTMDAEHLTKLIQRMPPGYRTVFNLFIVEGYSHDEISGMLGITTSTSKTQLFKARAWLQDRVPASMINV